MNRSYIRPLVFFSLCLLIGVAVDSSQRQFSGKYMKESDEPVQQDEVKNPWEDDSSEEESENDDPKRTSKATEQLIKELDELVKEEEAYIAGRKGGLQESREAYVFDKEAPDWPSDWELKPKSFDEEISEAELLKRSLALHTKEMEEHLKHAAAQLDWSKLDDLASAPEYVQALEQLVAEGDHFAIDEIFQKVNSKVEEQICDSIKKSNLLPPLYRKDEVGRDRYVNLSLAISSGDKSLNDIPFKHNHIPVLWATESDFKRQAGGRDFCRGTEKIGYEGLDPIYNFLSSAIRFSNWLVIASKPLTCALFSAVCGVQIEKTEYLKQLQIEFKERVEREWMVYQVPDSQYYVWVPKEHEQRYADLLNIERLTVIKPFDQKLRAADIAKICPTWFVEEVPLVKRYSEGDLEKIFKPYTSYAKGNNKTATLDFMLTGHGSFGKSATVANISVGTQVSEKDRLTSLLNYLNDKLLVGTVAVISCSAGGSNKLLLQELAVGVPLQYHYNLILNAISDKQIIAQADQAHALLQRYFANAAQLETGESTIETLCKELSKPLFVSGDIHGFANLSQVLLPGGHSFTGCAKFDEVFEATRGLLESEDPIHIRDKQVILWYAADIQNKVIVYANAHVDADAPALEPPIAGMQAGGALIPGNQPVVYPEFISMLRQKPILHFKEISVNSDQRSPKTGVLHFIRDAFFDTGYRADEMNIVIERLQGVNDIPWQIQKAREQAGIMNENPFEQLWQLNAGEPIELQNVFIRITPGDYAGEYTIELTLSDPDGKSWLSKFEFNRNGIQGLSENDYYWHFNRKASVNIPTVITVGEKLLSEGSRRFQKIKKVAAGHIQALASLDRSGTDEEYGLFKKEALRHALARMNLKGSQPYDSLSESQHAQLRRIFDQELTRAVMRARGKTRKVVAAKMDIEGRLLTRVTEKNFKKFGKLALQAAVKTNELVKDKLDSWGINDEENFEILRSTLAEYGLRNEQELRFAFELLFEEDALSAVPYDELQDLARTFVQELTHLAKQGAPIESDQDKKGEIED